MRSLFQRSWRELLVGAVVVTGLTAAVCKLSPGCPIARAADPATAASRSWLPNFITKGDNKMISIDKNKAGKVEHATTATFEQMVLKSTSPVLVDFYADWCGPCQRLAPVLDQVAAEVPGARVVKVNVDQNPELAGSFGISSIPALMVFRDGRVVEQRLGLQTKEQLKSLVK